MASCDGRRMTVECGGAIGVFGIGRETGEVDVPGFRQLVGILGIHNGRNVELKETSSSNGL